MAIDFTLTPELEDIRDRVRTFIAEVVKPAEMRSTGMATTRPSRERPASRS